MPTRISEPVNTLSTAQTAAVLGLVIGATVAAGLLARRRRRVADPRRRTAVKAAAVAVFTPVLPAIGLLSGVRIPTGLTDANGHVLLWLAVLGLLGASIALGSSTAHQPQPERPDHRRAKEEQAEP